MDGVLFDTEKLYERFWCEASEKFGFAMNTEDVAAIRSTDSKIAKRILKERLGKDFDYEGVKKLRIELMHRYTEAYGVELKPGTEEFLRDCKEKHYRIALATTSNMERALDFLTKGGIREYFDEILTGDRVLKGKPDPEIYERAAEGLRLSPMECYAVEDSFNGVRSAYSAGCKVIMVRDRDVPDSEMEQKTYKILTSLESFVLENAESIRIVDKN